MENISYPYEAKNKNITGKFFIVVKTQEGGKISNINVIGKDERITVPLVFNEILIIDKPTSSNRVVENTSEYVTRPIAVLENEAFRVSKMFESLNLPEWQSKKMEFAILFYFKLTD